MSSTVNAFLMLDAIEEVFNEHGMEGLAANSTKPLRAAWKEALAEMSRLRNENAKLKNQLTSRNQAAEAMGVLDRLVKKHGSYVRLEHLNAGGYIVEVDPYAERHPGGNSLIEAVLKAGGDDANPTR